MKIRALFVAVLAFLALPAVAQHDKYHLMQDRPVPDEWISGTQPRVGLVAQKKDAPKLPRGSYQLEGARVGEGCVLGESYCSGYSHHLYLSFAAGSRYAGWTIGFRRDIAPGLEEWTRFSVVQMSGLDGTYVHIKSKDHGRRTRCTIYVSNAETKAEWERIIDRYQPHPANVIPRVPRAK